MEKKKHSSARSLWHVLSYYPVLLLVSLRNRTVDKRDRVVTCVFCRDYHLMFFYGLLQKDLFKGGCSFQTKLMSRLSHKICRLFSSPVLLCKLTSTEIRTVDNQLDLRVLL